MSLHYFWNVYIRAPILALYWYKKHMEFECKAGYGCDWVYPYGFVPEAECPIHDQYAHLGEPDNLYQYILDSIKNEQKLAQRTIQILSDINTSEIYKDFAKHIDDDSLTDNEKMQALLNHVLEKCRNNGQD